MSALAAPTINPPSGVAVARLANAMAVAAGFILAKLPAEERDAYSRAANGALIFLAMEGAGVSPAAHVKALMDAIAVALRTSADAMDGMGGFREELIKATYQRATDAEIVSRVLRGEVGNPITETEEGI